MKMVSSCWVLVALVCASVQAAPQSSGGTSSSSSNKPSSSSSSGSNKPDTRFFNPQQSFNQQGFIQGVTAPPNTPVNVVNTNSGNVVGLPIQQCSFFCRSQFTGRYECCDNQQQSHPGQCPTPRPSCPPTRNFGVGPQFCSIDIDCPYPNKCCLDTCLEGKVCKPGFFPQFNQFNQFNG